MKLFGMRGGLLGGLFNRGGSESEPHQDEGSATSDRLSRISQRGKQDTPLSPYSNAPQADVFDPATVPQPGYAPEAGQEEPLDLVQGYHEEPAGYGEEPEQSFEHSDQPHADPYEPVEPQDFEPEQAEAAEPVSGDEPSWSQADEPLELGQSGAFDDEAAAPTVAEVDDAGPAWAAGETALDQSQPSDFGDEPALTADFGDDAAPAFPTVDEPAPSTDVDQPVAQDEPVYEDYTEPAPVPAAHEEPVYEDYSEPAYPAAEEPASDFLAEPTLSSDCNEPDERPRIMPTMNFATDFMDEGAAAPAGEFGLAPKAKKTKTSLGLSPMVPGEESEPEEDEAERTAIVFRQIFPPSHGTSLSFFGGLPIASGDFEWPRSASGIPYSFVMQVDCAEIPPRARQGLPESGILYVFMHMLWGDLESFRVIHEDAGGEVVEVEAPDDLPALYEGEARHVWKWPRAGEASPTILPKWPFKPVAIDLADDLWDEADDPEGPRLWPGGVNELLLEAQGEDVPSNYFTIKDFTGAENTLIRPWHQFPHDAQSIRITTGLLLARIEDKYRPVPGEWRQMPEEERNALIERIREEAQGWYDDASAEPPFIEVPQEVADQYWDWVCSIAPLARFVMTDAVTLSVEASLTGSAEAAARVPSEIAARIRHRHALVTRSEEGELHANTPDRMMAPPLDIQGNQYERAQDHVLLLELSSNEGIGHHFGEGVYQFWIKPEDLAAGRFDKVELTADAY